MGIKARPRGSRLTPSIFNDFDPSDFWQHSTYARQNYVSSPPSDALIASVEAELGFRFPAAYVELMRLQNGGIPKKQCFPTTSRTSWAEDHVAISGISGIGRQKTYSVCGQLGSKFMQDEWGYPDIGVCICDCPSAGHDMIMLDYRACGRDGEPAVVHVDQENDYAITFLAADFATFVRGLVHESVFDTAEEDLNSDLERIERGSFSTLLTQLLSDFDGPDLGPAIRNACRKLTTEKGHFTLQADKLSVLVYDVLFLLYTASNRVSDKKTYLEKYPDMLALGDGGFTTGSYAAVFVENWMKRREKRAEIILTSTGSLEFAGDFRTALLRKTTRFGD